MEGCVSTQVDQTYVCPMLQCDRGEGEREEREGGRRGREEREGGEGGRRGREEREGGEGGRRGREEREGRRGTEKATDRSTDRSPYMHTRTMQLPLRYTISSSDMHW